MMSTMDENKTKINVKCLAVDPYVVDNIVKPTEVYIRDKHFIGWGDSNDYPDYIEDLYQNVATLHSIVDGTTDYVCGDDIIVNLQGVAKTNRKGQSLEDVVKWAAKDLVKYNGFALNIIENQFGTPAEVYYLDFKRVRSNEDGTKYYYSLDWSKSYGRVKYIEYDSFFNKDRESKSSVFYYKNDVNKVYPTPIYGAAVIACEIERKISIYHLNAIDNSFSSNYIINLNNGRPSDEIKEEIENEIYDKFCGPENSGRPMLSFNENKDAETTVQKIDSDNFIDKYNALTQRTQQEIFTAFRASPLLFGIDQEKTGFNANEYASAFRLFNKTVVEPLQKVLITSFDKIFNTKNAILIEPFTINFDKTVDA